jgi:hypothetical protein
MKTKRIKPTKVRANIAITKEAQDIMFDHGYASQRTVGMFISELIVDYHAKRTRKPTQAEIAQELHRLASSLEEVNQYSKVDNSDNCQSYPPDKPMPLANIIDSQDNFSNLKSSVADKPMPLANIIDSPPGLVGVTVISEEDGCKEDKA